MISAAIVLNKIDKYLNMDLEICKKVLQNEPKFRYRQVNEALYKKNIGKWSEASNLPKKLITDLEKNCPLEIRGEILHSKNKEAKKKRNTIKAILTLHDSLKIETVLMRHSDGRNTICLSSQVGCPMGCLFCATGQMGFKRNLSVSEIIEQVFYFSRYLKSNFGNEARITNAVFMGMGEPMLNYENVWQAIAILNNPEKFNIGARKISVSSVGVVEGIKKMSREKLQINLAISLHASSDTLRRELIPSCKHTPLKKLFFAVDNYIEKTGRQVMFEYLLIDNINDTKKNALELVRLIKKPLYVLNIIPYNQTGKYRASSRERIDYFKNILQKNGVKVNERREYGGDIKAACGQLNCA